MKKLLLIVGLFASLQTYATPFSLEGYTVDAYIERTIPDPFYGSGRINGYGLDAPFTVQTGTSDMKQYSDVFTLDVDKDKFSMDFLSARSWQNGISFKIVEPDYATTTTEGFWYGLGWDTNLVGVGVDVGLGWLSLDLSNVQFNEDSYFLGYFNYQEPPVVASLPEPSPFVLFGFGLVALVLKRRKKVQKQ